MSCNKIVGIKNILLTFTNCDSGQVVGPIAHELSTDEEPKIRSYEWTQEDLKGGFTKRKHHNPFIEIKVIRDPRVPLKDYQGRSQIDLQVEYVAGYVYTGSEGGVTGDPSSDTYGADMKISFPRVDELLPPGSLMAA